MGDLKHQVGAEAKAKDGEDLHGVVAGLKHQVEVVEGALNDVEEAMRAWDPGQSRASLDKIEASVEQLGEALRGELTRGLAATVETVADMVTAMENQ